MKKILCLFPLLLFFLACASTQTVWAQNEYGYDSPSDAQYGLLTPDELDDLVAPIALYPDPLIAQILPAATFVDQIDEAARYVRSYGEAGVDDQPWDLSVRAVAHYPDVLYMMDQRYDWTVALGQAYIDQPQDVMDSIQALRADAMDQGNLVSTPQQQVVVDNGEIRIDPATPQYIYVPVYDPQVIYYEPSPSYGYITFGTAFYIGPWLSRDCDWRHRRVYYHGWRGRGWVERSRPHVRERRGVYDIYNNRRAETVTVNRRVLQHDTRPFRRELRQEAQRRREMPGRATAAPRTTGSRPGRVEQTRPGRVEQPQPGRVEQPRPGRMETPGARPERERRPETAPERQRTPAPAPAPAPAAAAPAGKPAPATTPAAGAGRATGGGTGARDLYRGRDVQHTQPASRSGYGGYGTGKDATTYRERGQSSRENMRQFNRPGNAAPAARQAAPAARPAAPAASRPSAAPSRAPAPTRAAPAQSAPRAAPSGGGGRDRR